MVWFITFTEVPLEFNIDHDDMADLVLRYVCKITQADWLPSRPIGFAYGQASSGGKISEPIWQ